jgi:hypothetical protein
MIPNELDRSLSWTYAKLAIERPRRGGVTPAPSARDAHPELLQRARCFA